MRAAEETSDMQAFSVARGTILFALALVLVLARSAAATFTVPAAGPNLKGYISGGDPPISCEQSYPNTVAIEIQCADKAPNCGHRQLLCASVPGRTFTLHRWVSLFSEEGPSPLNTGQCPDGWWVTGLLCEGKYCDNESLECTKVLNTHAKSSTCYYSKQFDEHDGSVRGKPGYWIRSVTCSGSYCGNITVEYCHP